MTNRTVLPLADIAGRMPEQGRIRLGEKTGSAMRSLDTFRFTSPDRDALVALARQYGGTVQPWADPKAGVRNQWELRSTAATIAIALPPGSLSVWMELWSDAGLQRRCDGVGCEETLQSGFRRSVPCLCEKAGKLACAATTRMAVILPGLPFGGVWRMETKSWNAMHELRGMEQILSALQQNSGRLLAATLTIEKRSKVVKGQRKVFVVPKLAIRSSIEELMSGQAELAPMQLASPAGVPALEQGGDDDLVEAEVVEEDQDVNAREWAEKIAATYQITDEDERCQELAVHVLRRFPWMRTVEHCLDMVARGCTRGSADYGGLSDEQRVKLIGVLHDLAEGKATAEEVDGDSVRLKRV